MEGVSFVVEEGVIEMDDEVAVLLLVDGAGLSNVVDRVEGGVESGVGVEFYGTGARKAVGKIEVSYGEDGIVVEGDDVADGGLSGKAGGVPGGVGGSVGEKASVATDEEFPVVELGDGAGFGWGNWSVQWNAKRDLEG